MTKTEFVAMVRRENPELAAVVDQCKQLFPGAKVSYLKHGDQELGERTGVNFPAQPSPLFLLEQDRAKRKTMSIKRGRRR